MLLKLLGDGILHAGDGNLSRRAGLFYPIRQIKRVEDNIEITFSVNKSTIDVLNGGNGETKSIPSNLFSQEAVRLLNVIRSTAGSSFASPATESFINKAGCKKLKAKSTDKTDIKIVIHDMRTCAEPELGFSIKSYLGGSPTLLNPGKTTNFIFRLSPNLPADKVAAINAVSTKSKLRDRVKKMKEYKVGPVYLKPESDMFKNNMILIDGDMPKIIGHMLYMYYGGEGSTVKELTKKMQTLNPLNYDMTFNHGFYEYKIKKFLTDCALGMMPATVWNGHMDANGGYVVVKEDGEIVCYHIYNRNEFEDYLFENTRFETASTKRYEFGEITTLPNGEQIFKLNLQIRFV